MKNTPSTYFPELEGEEQRIADEWLHDYIRLVLKIVRRLRKVEGHKERGSST